MRIYLDLDYDEAIELLARLRNNPVDIVRDAFRDDLIDTLDNAIQNESERRYESQQESLRESGGVDDSQYRAAMKDAGRGYLIR